MTGPVVLALALATFAAVLALLTWLRLSLHLDAEAARRRRDLSLASHLAPLPLDYTHSSERSDLR